MLGGMSWRIIQNLTQWHVKINHLATSNPFQTPGRQRVTKTNKKMADPRSKT